MYRRGFSVPAAFIKRKSRILLLSRRATRSRPALFFNPFSLVFTPPASSCPALFSTRFFAFTSPAGLLFSGLRPFFLFCLLSPPCNPKPFAYFSIFVFIFPVFELQIALQNKRRRQRIYALFSFFSENFVFR